RPTYQVGRTGDVTSALALISGTVLTTETAACWVAVTPDNHFSYVANTGSGTVSGYSVAAGGQITLLNSDGRTGITGGAPADETISPDGQYLYVRVGGTNNIVGFKINANGSLTALGSPTSLPAGTAGLASR
ncbi:MAG: beta-propeller fold lactonase family protein, partial [Gemmatimonadaceae bacterium]